MTPEERLDKLIERHEALTQSLELLSHLHQDGERRLQELADKMQELGAKTDARLDKLLGIVERLTTTVESHERRLDRLEHP